MTKTKILFIMPSVGRKKDAPYVKSWKMEPLPIATLSALTPDSEFEKFFADDRLESIPYDLSVDLVVITVETYTARRAYQITRAFQQRGVPVVLGGFHVSLIPEDATEFADAIVIGEAEGCWDELLMDFREGKLKKQYHSSSPVNLVNSFPDRGIYQNKKYINLAMLETSRGCPYQCEFCSISAFSQRRWQARPIADIIKQISQSGKRNWFFIDDNIGIDNQRFMELLQELVKLKIRWVGQISVDIANSPEVLELMRKSGCAGVLIGFESINSANLSQMQKTAGRSVSDYESAVASFRAQGIAVYGTFLFGYDSDTRESFEETLDFTIRNRLFFAAFNHLVPFPGTPLYERLKDEKRLLYDKWWLDPEYRFGDVAFQPKNFSPQELSELCLEYRRKFYRISSVFKRGWDFQANCRSPFMFSLFYLQNLSAGKDVELRQKLPLGIIE